MSDTVIIGVVVLAVATVLYAAWAVWRELTLTSEDEALRTVLNHIRSGGLKTSLAPSLVRKAERAGERRRREHGGGW